MFHKETPYDLFLDSLFTLYEGVANKGWLWQIKHPKVSNVGIEVLIRFQCLFF